MAIYRITCDDNDQYDVSADHVEVTDVWVKFYQNDGKLDRSGMPTLIAIVSNIYMNNIQLVNPETGKADRIKPV